MFEAHVEDGDDPAWTQSSARTGELFCAPIDSTDENYKIPKPSKNAWVLKSTSGTGDIYMKSDVFRYI
jgi:hypothetical protein